MTDPASEHQEQAELAVKQVACAVLTVSDTRDAGTDVSGPKAARLLEVAGHVIVDRGRCRDEPDAIGRSLDDWCGRAAVQAVIMTGGTGIGTRDRTVEVVRDRLTIELEGFGEIFRWLSYEAIGPNAMMSRAVAGIVVAPPESGGETVVFAIPGSPKAVELAITRLIGPQLSHIVWVRVT